MHDECLMGFVLACTLIGIDLVEVVNLIHCRMGGLGRQAYINLNITGTAGLEAVRFQSLCAPPDMGSFFVCPGLIRPGGRVTTGMVLTPVITESWDSVPMTNNIIPGAMRVIDLSLKPNEPLKPGEYSVSAEVRLENGTTLANKETSFRSQ